MDHILDTFPGRGDDTLVPGGKTYIQTMRKAALASDITLFDIDDRRHGITHLISAEQGITLPGLIVACPDSHTCTLGALGAIGWGIGTSDCEHVLATETLRTQKPRQLRVEFDGSLGAGVTAKDMILHVIARYTAAGAAGSAMEYTGQAVSELGMDERFTLCNMAVEFSAFTGLIAPDQKTIEYVRGRSMAPSAAEFAQCENEWLSMASDADAEFDLEYRVDCATIEPTVTWGTSPEHAIAINDVVPDPAAIDDSDAGRSMQLALDYMGLEAGQALRGTPIDAVFIGSCTNARLADLQAAARILDGRKVAPGVKAICTPGSQGVKRAAEAEGLDEVFRAAGFEWREPGCSLCFNAGGEGFDPGERIVSSTNRNFRGRQGPMARTHLASPAMVAAAAVAGSITDCREY
jgi:3-isopropylmalate/(R)-2-methylmalate dehydratase large subunit